jgi:transposase
VEEAIAKYRPNDYSQRVMIPVSLQDQLMPGTLEFAIHAVVGDRMNVSVFEDRYNNDETGRWAYDPNVLLKVILFGYMRGLISSLLTFCRMKSLSGELKGQADLNRRLDKN